MIRSTVIVSLAVLGTLLWRGTAQDAPEPVAQPAQLRSQPPQGQQVQQVEIEANAIQRRESKGTIVANKKSGQVSRHPRAVEVRPFALNNNAFGTETPTRPLMIRSSRADAKQMDQLSDDLTVMARILDKAIAEHTDGLHPKKVAGGIEITVLNAGLSSATRAMYVDDYGAIFTLSVNIPLKAQPQVVNVEPKEQKRRTPWQETQSELYGPGPRMIKRWQPALWRQFDQEEVDAFKAMLVETLREATNIRHLKPNDIIAVVVRGMPQSEERDARLKLEDSHEENAAAIEETANPESTLVLRIPKMDLDRAVASGRDSGELRKTVRISIY